MKVFGLTGGSGTGKTTVAQIFENNGIYIVRADVSAHNVEQKGTQCYDELVNAFGTRILKENGDIDRRSLGKIVFSDMDKLRSLNRITHHYIKYDIMRELRGVNSDCAAIDGAVIIGSPVQELCEFIVAVEADYDERVRRIVERDQITPEMAKMRVAAQPDDDFYRQNARFIIKNNGSYDDLKKNTEDVIRQIIK